MFEKRKDIATVSIWQNGCVTINRGLGYARYFDKVYPSDIERINKLATNKQHTRKLKMKAAQLRFHWFRDSRGAHV